MGYRWTSVQQINQKHWFTSPNIHCQNNKKERGTQNPQLEINPAQRTNALLLSFDKDDRNISSPLKPVYCSLGTGFTKLFTCIHKSQWRIILKQKLSCSSQRKEDDAQKNLPLSAKTPKLNPSGAGKQRGHDSVHRSSIMDEVLLHSSWIQLKYRSIKLIVLVCLTFAW